MLDVAEAAQRRGDDVVVVTPPSAEVLVRDRGLRWAAGASPEESELSALWERFSSGSRAEAREVAEREIFARRCTAAMWPAVRAVADSFEPDLVLREPCEYSSALVAADAGLPVATVGISFCSAEWSVLDYVEDILETYRAGVTDVVRSAPFLSGFPASLDPSPFPDTRRFGRPAPIGEPTLPDFWNGRGGPLVYVSFGTMVSRALEPSALYAMVYEAVEHIEARVLVTVGRSVEPSALGSAPPNVHVEQWVPQASVLPHADVVVCHGGSGTTYGALACGVPAVFVPFFADQPANARAVVGAGAGLLLELAASGGNVPSVNRDDAQRLRALVEAVMSDAGYRQAAGRIGAELQAQPSLVDVLAGLGGAAQVAPL